MRNWVRKALTARLPNRTTRRVVVVPPSDRLVYGVTFAIYALLGLVVLQIAHLIVLHSWNTEIFAAITLIIGTILGAFFGQRG